MGKPPHPVRWAKVLAWLILLGLVVIGIGAANGAAREQQLVDASRYFLAGLGFAIGLLIGARMARDETSPALSRYSAVLVVGLIGAAIALAGRWYYLTHFFK
jgi:hypothetical protein